MSEEKKSFVESIKSCEYDGKEVIDSLGRKIVLRKPKMREKMQLMSIVGNDNAINMGYMYYATSTLYVAMIDGSVFKTPVTKVELDVALDRLEEEGIDAVTLAVSNSKRSQSEEQAEIKK